MKGIKRKISFTDSLGTIKMKLIGTRTANVPATGIKYYNKLIVVPSKNGITAER